MALFALSPAAPAPARPLEIPYAIDGPADFRAEVRATLDDPRGWALGGAVSFREVGSGGRFTVRLVSPEVVASFFPCSAFYSCRSGEHVLVNAMRWEEGAESYGDARDDYRRHVINHEVGHALGFGHADCRAPGAAAPVMQQQSKGLGACVARPWPLPAERRALASTLGVRARAVGPPPHVLARLVALVRRG